MKTLNLNDFGVQEMKAEEMRKTEGGKFWPELLIGYAITEWSNIKKVYEMQFQSLIINNLLL